MESPFFLPALAACRLLLAWVQLPVLDGLQIDHQLTSPLTSYFRLKEGLWLYHNGVDPYLGGILKHSPLFLSLFSAAPPGRVAWALSDIVGAWALVRIWHSRQQLGQSRRDGLVGAAYLVNPYLLLPSLASSTSTFENAIILLTLMFAVEGRSSPALLALALSVHLSLSTLLLLVPVLMLLVTSPTSRLASPRQFGGSYWMVFKYASEFVVYWSVLVCAASIMAGGVWNWMHESWGASLILPDLTPNPGLWWYFFTEMFDHFRPFFLMVFSTHLAIYVMPVCIKFQHDALYAAFLLLGILGTFKPYLTLADPGLFLSMFAVFPEIYPYLRHAMVTALLHAHASLLLPLFHALWVIEGRGNANFYYAASLVMGIAGGAGIVDACFAGMRIAIGNISEAESGKWEVVQE
ncbi:PIG-U-domain-containing protein [Pisolithus croceorrhizus]|nr:PIG-U-domain-containing protein [Pisolithus croceorrhizus]KAI6134738.1 PIG-U-domain-containing protein [Pisolithus croceorrhizus]